MPTRRLPNSDATLTVALQRAHTKLQPMPAADRPVSAPTVDALHLFLTTSGTNWPQLQVDASVALVAQGAATRSYQAAFAKGVMYVSHFVQVLNLAITRGELPVEVRAYYGLDLNDTTIPPLTADADLQLWGPRLIAGEAARVAAGGTPMQFPSITDVESRYTTFVTAGETARTAQAEYQRRLDLIAAQRPEAERLVNEVWDDIENHYRREETSARRRLCRAFGVVYVALPDDKSFDGLLAPGASAVVVQRVLGPETRLRLRNESPAAKIRLCAAATDHAPCPDEVGIALVPGEERDFTRAELGPAGNSYLTVTNLTADAEAHWELTVLG